MKKIDLGALIFAVSFCGLLALSCEAVPESSQPTATNAISPSSVTATNPPSASPAVPSATPNTSTVDSEPVDKPELSSQAATPAAIAAADSVLLFPTPKLIEALDYTVSDVSGLAFDSNRNLYVADGLRLTKFTPEGEQTTMYLGSNVIPTRVACDSADNVYASGFTGESGSERSHKIWKLTPTGQVSLFTDLEAYAEDLTVDSDGGVYVIISGIKLIGGCKFNRFDSSGNLQSSRWYPAMTSITFDSSGHLFVGGSNGVFEVNRDGETIATFISGTNMPTFGQTIRFDRDGWLYIDADYDLYVAGNDGTVRLFAEKIGQEEASLAFGPDNRLYAGEYYQTKAKILRITILGTENDITP